MVINTLKLHNFRCFEDLELEFDKKLTVIAGRNGAGKSSILDAIVLANTSILGELVGFHTAKIEEQDVRQKCFQLGSSIDSQAQYPLKIDAKWIIDSQEVQVCIDKTSTFTEHLENIGIGDEYARKMQLGFSETLPIHACYGTGRMWSTKKPSPQTEVSFQRQNGYDQAIHAHLDTKRMTEWFERMTYKQLQSGQSIPEFSAVCRATEEIFKRLSGCTAVTVQVNLDTHEIEVFFEDAEKHKLSIQQLSDGYRGMLCLVADIAYRMAVLNPQLLDRVLEETDGIVLIDEVDLHLHPAWQRRILGDLMAIFPKVQFIVTTHAPAVLQSVGRQHIQILENNTVHPAPLETYGKDMNGITKAVMEVQERPDNVMKQFEACYDALDSGDYQRAEQRLEKLEKCIGSDPEITSLRVQLDLERRWENDDRD